MKQYYDKAGLIRLKDTEWFVSGELLQELYKDKDGNWVDKGNYVLVEEPAWICKEDDTTKQVLGEMEL